MLKIFLSFNASCYVGAGFLLGNTVHEMSINRSSVVKYIFSHKSQPAFVNQYIVPSLG